MRGIPLRCLYHLYTKKEYICKLSFLLTNLLYEEVKYEKSYKNSYCLYCSELHDKRDGGQFVSLTQI